MYIFNFLLLKKEKEKVRPPEQQEGDQLTTTTKPVLTRLSLPPSTPAVLSCDFLFTSSL
jgi:hypothetical protein